MAEETLQIVPHDTIDGALVPYVVDFDGQQRRAAGIKFRLGRNAFGEPVAQKIAIDSAAVPRLLREHQVAKYLGRRGGELLAKCLGHNLDATPAFAVVGYRGRPLTDLVSDGANWELGHDVRMKIITDLLQGLELLRVAKVTHGAIGLDTLHWDGTALQITDFGRAALEGQDPDGRLAEHADDVYAAGRLIYHVYTGQPPPADPVELRSQIEHVQDAKLRNLLLRRDILTRTDLNYVFAEDPAGRPSSRVLLDRLDERPHGIQADQLLVRDREIRADFRRLRDRQQRFRDAYESWIARRDRLAWPSESSRPRPRRTPLYPPAAERPVNTRPWFRPAAVAVGALVAVLAIVGLLL